MSDQPPNPDPSALEKTQALLASLWDRNLPTLRQRLDLLDRAAAICPVPPELLTEAVMVAHNLSGSLGMFGHSRATELARELEYLFRNPDTAPADKIQSLTQELRVTLALPDALPGAPATA